MGLILNKPYQLVSGGIGIILADTRTIGSSVKHGIMNFPVPTEMHQFPYIGVCFNGEDFTVTSWNTNGIHYISNQLNIRSEEELEVGKFTTVTGDMAVITAVSEAVSQFPFVGYIQDDRGRLVTCRWNSNGAAIYSTNQNAIDLRAGKQA